MRLMTFEEFKAYCAEHGFDILECKALAIGDEVAVYEQDSPEHSWGSVTAGRVCEVIPARYDAASGAFWHAQFIVQHILGFTVTVCAPNMFLENYCYRKEWAHAEPRKPFYLTLVQSGLENAP